MLATVIRRAIIKLYCVEMRDELVLVFLTHWKRLLWMLYVTRTSPINLTLQETWSRFGMILRGFAGNLQVTWLAVQGLSDCCHTQLVGLSYTLTLLRSCTTYNALIHDKLKNKNNHENTNKTSSTSMFYVCFPYRCRELMSHSLQLLTLAFFTSRSLKLTSYRTHWANRAL